MLTIRLQRTGTKNKPAFRLVLAEAHRAAGKKALEVLGHYNPRNKELGIRNKERLEYWIEKHVSVSPTVHNLLIEKKIMEGKKVKAWQPKKKVAAQGTSPASTAPAKEVAVAVADSAPVEPQA